MPVRRTFVSTEHHSRINADQIAERFGIGPIRAAATLRATLQRGMRSAILPTWRRYKVDRMFQQKRLSGKFSTDTAWVKIKSLNGNVASQVYTHKCGFVSPHNIPKADNENVGNSLASFISQYGIPEHLTFDGAMVQRGRSTRFMSIIRINEIKFHISGPYWPDQNPAEGLIRETKKRFYRLMNKKRVPMRLWDFAFDWVCETGNITVNSSRYAKGRTPIEIITGITPDITEYLDFGFYDWVVY